MEGQVEPPLEGMRHAPLYRDALLHGARGGRARGRPRGSRGRGRGRGRGRAAVPATGNAQPSGLPGSTTVAPAPAPAADSAPEGDFQTGPQAAPGGHAPQPNSARKHQLTWQVVGKRMLKNIKPTAYPVLVHGIPDTVSVQEVISSFSAFGALLDVRYGYTDMTKGIAVGLFRKSSSVSKVVSVRKSVRKDAEQGLDPASVATSTVAAAPGPAQSPTPTADAGATQASDPPPSNAWLKIFLGQDAFYYQFESKSYTLDEPRGKVSEVVDWTAEPKRFAKAMKRAKQQDASRKRKQVSGAEMQNDETRQSKRSRKSPPSSSANRAVQSRPPAITKVAKVARQVEEAIAGYVEAAATAPRANDQASSPTVSDAKTIEIGSVVALEDDPSVQGPVIGKAKGYYSVQIAGLDSKVKVKKFRLSKLRLVSPSVQDAKAPAQVASSLPSPPQRPTADEVASYKAFQTAPVFSPTEEEFESPIDYIRSVVMPAATEFGLAIIRPPDHTNHAAAARKQLMQRLAKPFRYRRQLKHGNQDVKSKMNFKSWQACDHADQSKPEWPTPSDNEQDRDAEFFSVVRMEDDNARPCYASEIPCNDGVLNDELPWAPCRLPLLSQSPLRVLGWPSSGINAPQLFVARRFSFFAWHTEDLDLFSCNYMHVGAPKTWYAVSAEQRDSFEKAAESIECGRTLLKLKVKGKSKASDELSETVHVSDQVSSEKVTSKERQKFHRASVAYHRLHMTDPAMLATKGIKITRYIQHPGDLVITLPGAYHGGFSHGVSVAESSNFADEEWLDAGLVAEKRMKSVGLEPAFDMQHLIADWNEMKQRLAASVAPGAVDVDSGGRNSTSASDSSSGHFNHGKTSPAGADTIGHDQHSSFPEQDAAKLLAPLSSQQIQQDQMRSLTPESNDPTCAPKRAPTTPEGPPLNKDNQSVDAAQADAVPRSPALSKKMRHRVSSADQEPANETATRQSSSENPGRSTRLSISDAASIQGVIDDITTAIIDEFARPKKKRRARGLASLQTKGAATCADSGAADAAAGIA